MQQIAQKLRIREVSGSISSRISATNIRLFSVLLIPAKHGTLRLVAISFFRKKK
jgi:hypothetical protein